MFNLDSLQKVGFTLLRNGPTAPSYRAIWVGLGVGPASLDVPLQSIRTFFEDPASRVAMAMPAAPAPTMQMSKPSSIELLGILSASEYTVSPWLQHCAGSLMLCSGGLKHYTSNATSGNRGMDKLLPVFHEIGIT